MNFIEVVDGKWVAFSGDNAIMAVFDTFFEAHDFLTELEN